MDIANFLVKDHAAHLDRIQERLDYQFHDVGHLLTALIHSSFAFEQARKTVQDNEVLEFMGDAVLDLAVGNALFEAFPGASEGDLTRMRAALVNEGSLADLARTLELHEAILLGKGEEATGGRAKSSILSCAYEAMVGAVFVDGGYEAARVLAERQFAALIARGRQSMLQGDAKSRLQELTQQRFNEAPVYVLEKADGPDHARLFTVSVRFRGNMLAMADASSKKEAEQRAAAAALENFVDLDFNG